MVGVAALDPPYATRHVTGPAVEVYQGEWLSTDQTREAIPNR